MKNNYLETLNKLRALVGLFVLMSFSVVYAQCTHVLRLTDTYGDGWNGGTVSLSVNGTVVLANVTVAAGNANDVLFNASAGATIRVYRTAAGSFPSEMRVQVLNNAGTSILNTVQPVNGTPSSGGATALGNCSGSGCANIVRLTDTYGDGWNGGTISVSVAGTNQLTNITLSAGAGPIDRAVFTTSGQTIRVYRTAAGSYAGEMRVQVLNNNGTSILSAFQPVNGTATTNGTTVNSACVAPPAPCTQNVVTVAVTGGNYPSEVSWNLTNSSNTIVASGAANANQTLCLPTGCYTFNMFDSYGDGWNGATYTVTSGGSTVSTGTLSNGSSGSVGYIGIGQVCTPPAPSNDACGGATAIACGGTATVNTENATTDAAGSNFCGTSITTPGVWYSIAGNGQNMTVSTVGLTSVDTKLMVFSGSCAGLTCVGGNDDSGGLQSSVSWLSASGTTYYVLAAAYSGTASFPMSLTCTTPASNPCASITSVSCGTASSFSVASGSGSWNGYGPFGTPGIEKVYTFTPSFTGSYQVNVTNNGPSTYVDLFYGTACGQSSQTYLNDVLLGTESSTVSLVAGTTYYFVLDPESTSAYSGSISIGQSLAAPVVSGVANICGTGPLNSLYTINAVPGANNYTWSVTTGVGMNLQQGGPTGTYTGTALSRNILFSPTFTSGTLTVTANGTCGSSTTTYPIQRIGGGDFQITSVPYTNSSSTVGAGNNFEFYSGFSAKTSEEHAYSWTPDCSGSYTVSLCGSSYDTYLQVVSDICGGSPSVLAYNDDYCGLSSQLTYNFTAGTTYYILVEGFSSSSAGAYTLNVTPNAGGNASLAGTTSICGPGATTATYTVSGADAGTTYSWSLPAGMTANGATNGASINVNVDASFNSGSVTANLTSACGSASSLSISVARSIEDAAYSNEFSHSGNTIGASNSSSLRASVDNIIKWDVTCHGTYTLSLCGSGYDTYLYLTDGLPCNGGSVIALNDDFCGLQSQLTALVPVGTYYIVVEGWSSTGAGAYTLNVTGDNLSATFSNSDYNGYGVSCFGSTDGSINISATGGSGIEYSIDGGATWQSSGAYSGLAPGSYDAMVRQCLGDEVSQTIVLVEPTKVNISASNTEILCNGDLSTVSVSTWGGATPYATDDAGTYSVTAGDYTYNVVDANGCSASASVSITEPTPLTINAGGDETTFYGYGPMQCATLSATADGGTPGYSYNWNAGAGQEVTVCPQENGSYTATVTDANGCTASDDLWICVVNVQCQQGNSDNYGVEMCQTPPGNPNNAHTICIAPSAVPAHLAIGCVLGACGELEQACSGVVEVGQATNAAKNAGLSEVLALTAYPNPAAGMTTISVTPADKGNYEIRMIDMTGRTISTVYNGFISDFENLTFDVDMTELSTGVYSVNVVGDNGIVENIRIVKQ